MKAMIAGVAIALLTSPVTLSTAAFASSEMSWQEWARRNPTYRNLPRQPRPTAVNSYSRQPAPLSAATTSYSPNLQAFLRVIRYAEGTNREDGYQIQFTSTRFYNFTDHPRQVRCSQFRQRSLCSNAAGAYQFLSTTWDHVARQIGATSFSPEWQDRAAVAMLERAGVLPLIESGQIDEAIARTANIWASFPRWSGDNNGSYSQAVKPMGELVNVFHYYRNWFERS